jgi:hypothetical protein
LNLGNSRLLILKLKKMATIIKFEVTGLAEGENAFVVPSLNFGLNAYADVTNATQEINFQPISVTEFSFTIVSPKVETAQNLIKWVVNHETKNGKFSINKQALTESAREIKLEDICLTSYSENIDENYLTTNLSLIARKVTFGDVVIDLSKNR